MYNTINQHFYTYSAIRVPFTIFTDPTTGVRVRQYYDRGEKFWFKFYPGKLGGGKPMIYTDIILEPFERFRGVYDAAGKPVLGDEGMGYQINMVTPVLDPFGFSSGMSYGVMRVTDMFKDSVIQDDNTNTNKPKTATA